MGGWTAASKMGSGKVRVIAYNTNLTGLPVGKGSVATVTFSRVSKKGRVANPALTQVKLGSAQGVLIPSKIK